MLTINLEKRLMAKKSKTVSNQEQLVLDEANSILEKNESEDLEILKKMGLDYSIRNKYNIEYNHKSLLGLNQSRVFSAGEIETLCINYRLRCLHIGYYKGQVDPELPSKIKEFQTIFESHESNRKIEYSRFYIVAPKESFKLQKFPEDPLLFYPVDNENYYLVHKWGNDISIMSWIKALKMRTYASWYFINTLQYWVPLACILLFFFNMHPGFLILLAAGSVINFLIARFADPFFKKSYLERTVSKNIWNSTYI